ncbi:MAG TPA: YrzA family protein [Bacillota bacterium]|nr:YrzA family protein [Bacillota bacterium]
MEFKLDRIEDKIEFFESDNLRKLEKSIDEQIENNKVLLLSVHAVNHQVLIDPISGRRVYSAVVHFKAKK